MKHKVVNLILIYLVTNNAFYKIDNIIILKTIPTTTTNGYNYYFISTPTHDGWMEYVGLM